MKLGCPCGATIHDGTDNMSNRAWFIADQDWFKIADNPNNNDRISRDEIWSLFRSMYQCTECMRVALVDKDGGYVFFKPEDDVSFGALEGS